MIRSMLPTEIKCQKITHTTTLDMWTQVGVYQVGSGDPAEHPVGHNHNRPKILPMV